MTDMNMSQLVQWFQLEYPEIVSKMHFSTHHNISENRYITDGKNSIETKIESINPYHIEGDVWTHTMMVCKQAENMPYVVQLAALLHDIGKPSTRSINCKNGRVSFYNHDAVSAFMSLEILKRPELNLDTVDIAHIFNLIALHTQVFKLSSEQIAKLQDRRLVHDFIKLGQADHSGRFYSQGEVQIPHYDSIPFEKNKVTRYNKKVIILCGLPGSGKSTWIKKFAYQNDPTLYHVVSRDECLMDLAYQHYQAKDFTYNEAWKTIDQRKVDKLLKLRFKEANIFNTTIIDMTHMSKKSRKRSLSHFGPEYKKKCVVFLTDLPTNYLRNSQRDGKIIDERVIKRMMNSFYPPTLEEFDEIEYVI